MTKSQHKLALRKETLRALNSIDLVHVVGGDDAAAQVALDRSQAVNCPLQADATHGK
jgi:hypothetical protein